MTKTVINPLSEVQYDFILQQCAMVRTALFDLNGEELTFRLSGLTQVQTVLDSAPIESVTFRALSIAFTEIFLENNPEYKWVVVEKIEQRLAIRYLSSNVVWYPELSFQKAQGKDLTVRKMYLELITHMRKSIIKEGFDVD